jgi:hypothetical protein
MQAPVLVLVSSLKQYDNGNLIFPPIARWPNLSNGRTRGSLNHGVFYASVY